MIVALAPFSCKGQLGLALTGAVWHDLPSYASCAAARYALCPSLERAAVWSIPILRPDESPRDRAQRILDSLTHSALAELLSAGIVAIDGERVSATACDRRTRTRLIMRLVRYDGAAYEPVPAVAPVLRDVERAALAAAPLPAERPVTVRRLATLAGYKPTGHFHEAVRGLIDRGLLERIRGGVRRR